MQKIAGTGKYWHRRKNSVEINTDILQHEFTHNDAIPIEDTNIHPNPNAAGSPSTSLLIRDASQVEPNTTEEWAATRIQTAFRGFLVPNCFQLTFSCPCLTFIGSLFYKSFCLLEITSCTVALYLAKLQFCPVPSFLFILWIRQSSRIWKSLILGF